ncbi:hypothetical protein IF650_04820 [Cellulosimicrobium terreum]|nr:hypothetical protein [Cellulosimicrobium terreum]
MSTRNDTRTGGARATGSATVRPSRAVLARRRVVALLLLVGLVVGLVMLGQVAVRAVQPLFAAEDGAAGKVAPPEPEPTGPPETCGPSDLELSVTAGQAEVAPGGSVALAVTVRHVSARACLLDASDLGRPVVVTQRTEPAEPTEGAEPTEDAEPAEEAADEHVWSSADCGSGERMLLLGPGDVDVATVRWNGTRSAPGCEGKAAAADPGAYQVVVTLAGVDGATSKAFDITLRAPEPKETEKPAAEKPADDEKSKTDEAADEKTSDETTEKEKDADGEKATD